VYTQTVQQKIKETGLSWLPVLKILRKGLKKMNGNLKKMPDKAKDKDWDKYFHTKYIQGYRFPPSRLSLSKKDPDSYVSFSRFFVLKKSSAIFIQTSIL